MFNWFSNFQLFLNYKLKSVAHLPWYNLISCRILSFNLPFSGVLSCTRHSTLSSTTSLRSSSPCPLHTEWHASGTTLSSWSISTRGEYCGPGDQLQLTSTQIISGTCTPWTRPGWTRADPWWTRRRRPMSARRRTRRRSKNRALARFFAFTNLGHNIDTYVMSCARL